MRIKKKVFFLFIAIIIFTLVFSGCYSLGDGTEDEEDYRANYADIRLVDRESEVHEYSMADFYTDEAVNDLISPMAEEERAEYTYILIKTERALSLGEIAIYFDSTVSTTVRVQAFILDEDDIPTKVYTGKDGEYSSDESNEPDPKTALAEVSFDVPGKKDGWKEMYLTVWKNSDGTTSKRHAIDAGQFIVFRIVNNCYDSAILELEKAEERYNAVVSDDGATDAQKKAAENEYKAAQQKYQAEKNDLIKVPIRITAVLINAE